MATTVSHNSSSSTITTVDMSSLLLDESITQQKPLWCMYERKSACRRYSIDKIREKEKSYSGEPFLCDSKKVQYEYLTLQEKVRLLARHFSPIYLLVLSGGSNSSNGGSSGSSSGSDINS